MFGRSSGSGGSGSRGQYDVLTFLPEHSDVDKELFKKRCTTAEEKYRMLEARDKILRARIPKGKVRVEFATRLFGTCPDMSPEKERYMRQYQRQLTSFEILPGPELLVDHSKAIKVYSRSSADQEEPLPHELRPGPTLELTMNYLLHNIVPLAEDNEDILGDWYNFLWDRTRSIRKDITQQQLTNLRIVGLMEKCARFHIDCSSRLCELDVHHFDPKLNDENLMKCLQSLEHLYDDLRRRDVKCPNEPEFRAYQIMMNLNEGDILLAVQQRPAWILKSWEVQSAIKAHQFIFNKNFVGFFRLVKSFPYMFSCILHRYFYQVRYRALFALCKSSASRKADIQLIFSQIQRMLGYGNEKSPEFKIFCESHGLKVDLDKDRIYYNRRRFCRPESNVVSREVNLIESKQTTSIAEAINGEPLMENPVLTYRPHCSFTEAGFLKPGPIVEETNSEPLSKNTALTHTALSFNPVEANFLKPSPAPVLIVDAINRELPPQQPPQPTVIPFKSQNNFTEIGFPFPKRVGNETTSFDQAKLRNSTVDAICNSAIDRIMGKLLCKELEIAVNDSIYESFVERQVRERLRVREGIRTRFVEASVDKILERYIPSLVSKAALTEIQQHQVVQKSCELSANNLLDSNLEVILRRMCQQTLDNCTNEFNKIFQQLTAILKRLKFNFIFHKWRRNARAKLLARKRREEQILQDLMNFPAANPVGRSPIEILQQFRGNGQSPNIIKTHRSTKAWLDKYEKTESLAESFKTNVSNYVLEMYNKSQITTPCVEPTPTKLNEEYKRHCWKRRWSQSYDTEEEPRKTKSPRQEFHNAILQNLSPCEAPAPFCPLEKGSSKSDLLQQIKKFAEEARKEKENFKCSQVSDDLNYSQ